MTLERSSVLDKAPKGKGWATANFGSHFPLDHTYLIGVERICLPSLSTRSQAPCPVP